MEVPRTAKPKQQAQEHPSGGARLDFARNLHFWQKYVSQKRVEPRGEATNGREAAGKRGHRKSASNNFGLSGVTVGRPVKHGHVRSITSYNAMVGEKPRAKQGELKTRERQAGVSVDRAKKCAAIGLSAGKLTLGKKMASSTQKSNAKTTTRTNTAAVADFFKKPAKASEIRRRRENFRSFAGRGAPSLDEQALSKLCGRDTKQAGKGELVINNNISIAPQLACKENSFSGNIKISIDFYDGKPATKELKAAPVRDSAAPNLYDKKPAARMKLGFFGKKTSAARLAQQRVGRESELSRVRSNCISPTYNCYHKRLASEAGLPPKKLVFSLAFDMQKQASGASNKQARRKATQRTSNAESHRTTDAAVKPTQRGLKAKAGHRRNVLSLPGGSLSSLLTNLRVPGQQDGQKSQSDTPELSANKKRCGSTRRSEPRLRLSASPGKKVVASYSRISEEDNEDGAAESRNNSTGDRSAVRAGALSKSSDMSLQSYVSRSSDEPGSASGFRELCGSDKTFLFKLNTDLSKQRKLLMAKIREESKLSDEVPSTGLEYYHIEKLLGEGSYGKVYRATSVLSSAPVAIKCYERAKIKSETTCQRIMQEIEILKYTSHAGIIKLYEIFENAKYIFMVIEFVDSGDLLNYLKKHGVFEEHEYLPILKQVVRALHYLHASGILHRDVKLDNILIDRAGRVKICDFGVSRKMPKGELVHEHIGTPAYLAPEIVANRGYRGFAADVWSLGVMSYIALTGQVPFKGNRIEELHDSILHAEVTFEPDCRLSARTQTAIRGMLDKDPKRRLGLAQISELFGFRLGGAQPLETEFASEAKIEAIGAMGYAPRQIAETLEKEDINHVYALYRLMDVLNY